MPLDPPSLAAWSAGTINYAFNPSADSFRADAIEALTTWFDRQSTLVLGTEVAPGSNRCIEFSMGATGLDDAISMYPPPVHPEPTAGNVTLKNTLNIPLIRSSWYLREVLLHEIGHTLGFDHATTTASIMHLPLSVPYLGGLAAADVASLVAIYGPPPAPPPGGGVGLKFRNLMAMVRKPYYQDIPFFPGGETLSWIPSTTMETPTETPDGVQTTFTFASTPEFVYYNTTWLIEGIGYSRVGKAIQLLDDLGAVFAPPTGSIIRGILG